MTQNWTISGDYLEACNCDVVCQCLWMEPPDDDECTVSLAWHIRDGTYGDVDLSGLHAAWLVNCEEGNPFDPDASWSLVVLLDEAADGDRREALEEIFLGRAGGIFGVAVDAHAESVEPASAPFSFARDEGDFSLEIGDSVAVKSTRKVGVLDETGTVSPHPFTKSLEMTPAKSTTATVSYDDEFAWDVSGNSSFLGDFELANA